MTPHKGCHATPAADADAMRLITVLFTKGWSFTTSSAMQTLQRQAAPRKTLQWRPGHAAGQGNRLQVLSMAHSAIPEARGLFDPANDKDACGVGFIGAPSLHALAASACSISSQQSGKPQAY